MLDTPTDRTPGSADSSLTSLSLQRGLLRVGGVLLRRSRDRQGSEAVGLKTNVDVQQAIQTLTEQSRGHEQNHGGGQFEDHELRSDAPPCIAGRATAPLAQRCPFTGQGKVQRRHEREEPGGEKRDPGRKRQDTHVQAQVA